MSLFSRRAENLKIKNPDVNTIYAPISGKVTPLEKVADVVFSQKIMGDGIAIKPDAGKLYAPVSGVVSVVFPTRHVIGIEAENGANIIMHVGIDTVELNGKGFDVKVKQGDHVTQGQLLMNIDLKNIGQKYDMTTMVVVENSGDFRLEPTNQPVIEAGEQLMKLTRA
ncbi:MAG: PTS glucose transporter subunit IIA [Lachnospiraceae bacterium]|nr:PTS glucose transporter subunit IIA [Lachnospiraceae bacterium]